MNTKYCNYYSEIRMDFTVDVAEDETEQIYPERKLIAKVQPWRFMKWSDICFCVSKIA